MIDEVDAIWHVIIANSYFQKRDIPVQGSPQQAVQQSGRLSFKTSYCVGKNPVARIEHLHPTRDQGCRILTSIVCWMG